MSGAAVLALAGYVLISLLTLIVYAVDKSAARKGGRRVRERTLHLMALTGGWPGALIAQRLLRHKSRKQPFRAVFWLTVVLNCAVCMWLLTPYGGVMQRAVFGGA
jgi:uncharacterized membrane protein YsdA (DUF1294 family)